MTFLFMYKRLLLALLICLIMFSDLWIRVHTNSHIHIYKKHNYWFIFLKKCLASSSFRLINVKEVRIDESNPAAYSLFYVWLDFGFQITAQRY